MTHTCKNKNNRVSYVCFTLYRYGLGFIWENQGVCNMKRFLCEFRLVNQLLPSRLVQCHDFEGLSCILLLIKKKSHSLADYLLAIKNAVLRKHLVRLGVW